MILQHLNYLAVLVAAIVYFAIGGFWFSPMGFVNGWMAGHGITMPTDPEKVKEMRKEMPKYMVITFIACFIGTMALGYIETATYTMGWMTGVKMGIVASVFPAIAIGLSHMHTKKSMKLFMIDAGYHAVGLIAAAVILSVWK
jgi:hypothetical protein